MLAFAWIEFDEAGLQRAQCIEGPFQGRENRNELGLGETRDSIADCLSPLQCHPDPPSIQALRLLLFRVLGNREFSETIATRRVYAIWHPWSNRRPAERLCTSSNETAAGSTPQPGRPKPRSR